MFKSILALFVVLSCYLLLGDRSEKIYVTGMKGMEGITSKPDNRMYPLYPLYPCLNTMSGLKASLGMLWGMAVPAGGGTGLLKKL